MHETRTLSGTRGTSHWSRVDDMGGYLVAMADRALPARQALYKAMHDITGEVQMIADRQTEGGDQ